MTGFVFLISKPNKLIPTLQGSGPGQLEAKRAPGCPHMYGHIPSAHPVPNMCVISRTGLGRFRVPMYLPGRGTLVMLSEACASSLEQRACGCPPRGWHSALIGSGVLQLRPRLTSKYRFPAGWGGTPLWTWPGAHQVSLCQTFFLW